MPKFSCLDTKTRQNVFVLTLLLAIFIWALGFFIQRTFQYSIDKQNRIKFGSFGFYLAKFKPNSYQSSDKRVILLGNSVYQYSFIPKIMQELADADQKPIHIYNMAQISASLYDYVLQLAKISHEKIDLLVISLNVGTFSLSPKFKTDADHFAFDPDVYSTLPTTFYNNTFTYKSAADLALSSLIPLKRIDPILRWKLKLRDGLPENFLKWFSYPYLNIPQSQEQKAIQMTHYENTEHFEKYSVLAQLLDLIEKKQIPTLLIWQEQDCPKSDENYLILDQMVKHRPHIQFVNLSSYWTPDTFVDAIHPRGDQEEAYAKRHYQHILKALSNYGI